MTMKLKMAVFAYLSVLVLILTACDETVFVDGVISEDGVGISGVAVTICSQSGKGLYTTLSDGDGVYRLPADENLKANTLYVTFVKDGYMFDNEGKEDYINTVNEPDVSCVDVETQGYYPDTAIVESEKDLKELSSYQIIGGDLVIRKTRIKNLDLLSSITKVCGHVFIEDNRYLTSLSGLSSLKTVWFTIDVTGNTALKDVDCLKTLIHAYSISIRNNRALTNLHGLIIHPELVTSSITIQANPVLENLSGLVVREFNEDRHGRKPRIIIRDNPLLTSLKGVTLPAECPDAEINICDNPRFCSLEGLEDIRSLGALAIDNEPLLNDLSPLKDLEFIGDLRVSGTGISNLDGLENISTVKAGVTLENNPSLDSLAGLPVSVETQKITISSNESLTGLTGLTVPNDFQGLISVWYLSGITSLSGIHLPDDFKGGLSIYHNDNLRSVNLPKIKSMETLLIGHNPSLVSMDRGLEALSRVNTLHIKGNSNLISLRTLSKLTSVEILMIEDNPSLSTIEGLSRLEQADAVGIRGDGSLETLKGLDGLKEVGIIEIEGNDALRTLENLGALKTVKDSLLVHNNKKLKSIGMKDLREVQVLISFVDNPELCANLADDLEKQLTYASRLVLESTVDDNKTCP